MRVRTALNAGRAVGRAGAELEHIDREAWKIALDEAHKTVLEIREAEVREECITLLRANRQTLSGFVRDVAKVEDVERAIRDAGREKERR